MVRALDASVEVNVECWYVFLSEIANRISVSFRWKWYCSTKRPQNFQPAYWYANHSQWHHWFILWCASNIRRPCAIQTILTLTVRPAPNLLLDKLCMWLTSDAVDATPLIHSICYRMSLSTNGIQWYPSSKDYAIDSEFPAAECRHRWFII